MPQAGALGEAIEHGGERLAILSVAGEHLVGDRKALAVDHEPDHDLLAVGAVIARVAALGLVIAGALAFKIGRGEIVEIDRRIEIEQAALACNQRCLDGGAMRMQLVEHPIERVLLNPLKSAPRMLASAVRRIQSGAACSEHGAISRLSTIAQTNRCTVADSPQSRRMRSSSRRRQN